MADAIRIQGLNEFVRSLKQLDTDLPKALRVAFNAAGQVIVAEARSKVPSRSGRARASVRAQSTQKAFRISGGSKKVPYYPWLDFGGTTPIGGKRPFIKDGRYIYAAYFRHRDELAVNLETALIDTARTAGLEVD
ncbi:MAG TPA: HK97 gp10 family phage protein [Pseudonocardia sp.]